jgi:hypothetical protein
MNVKKTSLLLVFFTIYFFAHSQLSNVRNQWIDYSKSYYKFEVGAFGTDVFNYNSPDGSGIVRIPYSTLSGAGLGAVPAEQLQLWNNGKEVPIYITKATGTLTSTDYIEFVGHINDGSLDSALYPKASYIKSSHWSLINDSAAYFLTSNSGANKRIVAAANNASTATIAADKNFTYNATRFFHDQINPGYAVYSTDVLYSSTYDINEGWTSRGIQPNACGCGDNELDMPFTQLYVDTAGANVKVTVSLMGDYPDYRNVEVYLNNNFLGAPELDYFDDSLFSVTGISPKLLASNLGVLTLKDSSVDPSDQFVVSTMQITYPRLFNFNGYSKFSFQLAASATNGRLIKISNFNRGTALPVLYDFTNNLRYTGDTSQPGLVSFLLAPSSKDYNLELLRNDASAPKTIASLTQRNFLNFSTVANQGNYLIISNPLIYGSGSSNYVEQYRAYRASAAGGGYNSEIIDINEITDQFAYGVKKHPLAIKNFLTYARKNFAVAPSYLFIIGKGVTYNNYYYNNTDPNDDKIDLVPTWGSPGSDNLLASKDYTPIVATPVGRLSAVSPAEVGNYLAKVKQYEAVQSDSTQTIADKSWQKKVLQLVGADDPTTGVILDGYMAKYKRIIKDTFYGANVISYSKTGDPAGYPAAIVNFQNTYNAGSGLVSYFGHSSATQLDFNLADPTAYNNAGKYPFFLVNGCLAGNIFDYDATRLTRITTISEKFILDANIGGIGYLSPSSLGVTNYLDIFTTKFYNAITNIDYGLGFGNIMQTGITKGLAITGVNDFYGKVQAEQYTFNGDPSISTYHFSKPDYAEDSSSVAILSPYISIADSSFNVKVYVNNIGRAVHDSVHLAVTRKFPAGGRQLVFQKWFYNVYSIDSASFTLPVVGNRDIGTGTLTAVIDNLNTVDEISEKNNTVSVPFTVYGNDIRPVYPFNYSVITQDTASLFASTVDPLAVNATYTAQFDTTANFNSPFKKTFNVTSIGGLLNFGKQTLSLDNTVYYWRVSRADSLHWAGASFLRSASGKPGFSQSHYYQFAQSTLNGLVLDSVSHQFAFAKTLTNVFVNHSIYPTSGTEDLDFGVSVNGAFVTVSACVGSSIIFNVFDSLSFNAWTNTSNPFGAGGICNPNRAINFEYSTTSAGWRDSAAKFFDSIPNGDYVIAREIYNLGDNDWASVWARDSTLYGHNNTLYYRLKNQGVAIDSFSYPRTFIFMFKKNEASTFAPLSVLTQGLYDKITLNVNVPTGDSVGNITSPLFGPAQNWNAIYWNGFAANANISRNVNVYGVTPKNVKTLLYTLDSSQHTFNVSGVNAKTYPYMQLQLNTKDTISLKPYQLSQWNVNYTPSPELALAPNLGYNMPGNYSFRDTGNAWHDTLSGYVTIKNVSPSNFDSMKAFVVLTNSSNEKDSFYLPGIKSIKAWDSLHLAYGIVVSSLPTGTYNMELKFAPAGVQYDQYAFNDFLYQYNQILKLTPGALTITLHAEPDATSVLGKWSVQNETDVVSYELEHSLDGVNFNGVGVVAAYDGSAPYKVYSLLHTSPIVGNNYYRVAATRKDGSVLYSEIEKVYFDGKAAVSIYPNPVRSQLNISLNNTSNKNINIRLINDRGQQVLEKSFTGSNSFIDMSKLTAGNYILVIDDGKSIKTYKVQKQN